MLWNGSVFLHEIFRFCSMLSPKSICGAEFHYLQRRPSYRRFSITTWRFSRIENPPLCKNYMSTEWCQLSIRSCILCDYSPCLPQASAQTFIRFRNSWTVCAKAFCTRLRHKLTWSQLSSTCPNSMFWLLPEKYYIITCFWKFSSLKTSLAVNWCIHLYSQQW